MKKTPVLTFLFGILLGAGLTLYWKAPDEPPAPVSSVTEAQRSESLDMPALDVGEIAPDKVTTEVDNSSREPEQSESEHISQMEAFERSIASEPGETQPAEEDPGEHREEPELSEEQNSEEPK